MAGKKVTVNVAVTNPETGESRMLNAGDSAPDWAKLGDHCYAEADDADEEEAAGPSQGLPGNVTDDERRRRAQEASDRAKARQKEADDEAKRVEAERVAAEKQSTGKPGS